MPSSHGPLNFSLQKEMEKKDRKEKERKGEEKKMASNGLIS